MVTLQIAIQIPFVSFFQKKKIVTVAFWQISLLWVYYTDCISFSIPRIFSKSFHLFLLKREKLSYFFFTKSMFTLWVMTCMSNIDKKIQFLLRCTIFQKKILLIWDKQFDLLKLQIISVLLFQNLPNQIK